MEKLIPMFYNRSRDDDKSRRWSEKETIFLSSKETRDSKERSKYVCRADLESEYGRKEPRMGCDTLQTDIVLCIKKILWNVSHNCARIST